MTVPFSTSEIEGVGGELKQSYRDFVVDEIPAYEPSGQGKHWFLRIESANCDGKTLLETVATHFGVLPEEVSTAGTKDKVAITRQWISLPDKKGLKIDPEVGALSESIEVLEVSRHSNKLRTGHLKGNRFEVCLRNTKLQGEPLRERVEVIAARIRAQGVGNGYGEQRFGSGASNLTAGLTWLKGGHGPRGKFLRSMALSAVQSEVFNRVLKRRMEEGTWLQALPGDIFEKRESGGKFWVEESELGDVQRRIESGEVGVTGPMPGSKVGLASDMAGEIEREALHSLGLKEEELSSFGRQARGARRVLSLSMEEFTFRFEGENAVWLSFSLPSGSYATIVVEEFRKC